MPAVDPNNRTRIENQAPAPTPNSRHNGSRQAHQASHHRQQAPMLRRDALNSLGSSGRSPSGMNNKIQGRSQKRKAQESGNNDRSSTNKKHRPNSPEHVIKDEAWVRKNFELPTREQYPQASKLFFEDPRTEFQNMKQNNAIDIGSEESKLGPPFLYYLECTFRGRRDSINVTGEGSSKRAASLSAYLMLLSEMHTSGFLAEYFNDCHTPLSSQTLATERDAKLDIYDYAARFDCLPQFSMRQVSKRSRGKSRRLVEVTITLPQQKISGVGVGPNLMDAEIAAAIVFKRAAEDYRAKSNAGSLIVKDPTAITSRNAKKFIDFYKIVNRSANFEVVLTEMKDYTTRGQGTGYWKGHVLLNGTELGDSIHVHGKKKAEDVAYLPAALELKKQNPGLTPKFVQALQAGNGEILRPIQKVRMSMDDECLEIMAGTLYDVREAGLPDVQEDLVADLAEEQGRRMRIREALSPTDLDQRSSTLSSMLDDFHKDPQLAEIRSKRDELPMNQYAPEVLELVNGNVYSIIIGATGSGKTTQVPQILLDKAIHDGKGGYCNIICTQPRRIAATSVACRVAVERNQPLRQSIGYHVRFDPKTPRPGGSVTYCTTGILLQQLQHAPDEVLDRNSHLIIDEVHERDILIDFLLIVLKRAISDRQKLGKSIPRVVLMSATIDADLFAGYFKQTSDDGTAITTPSLSVPGRLFPVTSQYLPELMEDLEKNYPAHMLNPLELDKDTTEYLEAEKDFQRLHLASDQSSNMGVATIDWKQERKVSSEGENILFNERQDALIPSPLIAIAISHITKTSDNGAILVFLPGLDEIVKVEDLLLNYNPLGVSFRENPKFKIIKVHSSLPDGQTEVFKPVGPNCRKIILSTNIAETSVTIPDVQFVLDTGKLREKRYDQVRRISRLACTWISKSNATQRAGRAGRVQNGNYIALYSRNRFDSLRAIGLPEMLRSDLQEICLDIKAQAFKSPIREFLAQAIEPPSPKAVDTSVVNLQALEALTDDEEITSLGRLLASLPVHPSLGKMIVLGVIFRCLDPMLVIGAAAAERNLFTAPLERRAEAHQVRQTFSSGDASDFMALYNAFSALSRVRNESGPSSANRFAYDNFIHLGAFRSIEAIARQIQDILVEANLIPPNRSYYHLSDPSLNTHSSNLGLIKALALAGHHPNLAVCMGGRRHRTPGEQTTLIHPSSVNYPKSKAEEASFEFGRLFTYGTMARSNDGKSIFLRDTSETTPLVACLFGGRIRTWRAGDVVEMDSWLPFQISSDEYRGEQRRAVKTLVEFRKAMDRLLGGAFQDLTVMRQKGMSSERATGSEKRYLADEGVRKIFADGLVEVLDRDVKNERGFSERCGGSGQYRPLGSRERSRDERDWRG